MENLRGKRALVLGATGSVGQETVKALLSVGVRVLAVARGAEGLQKLKAQHPAVETLSGDAADPVLATQLVRAQKPDLIVLASGVMPPMGPLDELTWERFSTTWNSDMQSAFHLVKAAVQAPLRPGSTVVVVSSGAAIGGSPLSGGYAGAKRMQWLLAGYAQQLSDQRQLGIRFVAVLPKQLIEGSRIGELASSTYGAAMGITAEQYLRKRFDLPLDARRVAGAIVSLLAGDVAPATTAIAVTAKGVESLG
jgi:NAD(P)-dependent dehydrogenase (short-subunit alcohol dehydrogenase family)